MECAIKKAIEGGWIPKGYENINLSILKTGKSLIISCGIGNITMQYLFWQALGKADGWEEKTLEYHIDTERWDEERKCIVEGFVERCVLTWEYHWHQFIDHLAAEKDPEEFFTKLLK